MQSNIDLMDEAKKLHIPLVDVVCKDKLKNVRYRQGNYGIIVNLQDDFDASGVDLSGTHWCVIYVEGNKACYFDPIGFPPPADVQLWLYRFKPYPYNAQQVQDESKLWCGMYCLHFIQFMVNNQQIKSLHTRMDAFLKLYLFDDDDLPRNEILLKKYMGF